jgi:NitT/TauT family transport system substrate-binding protein
MKGSMRNQPWTRRGIGLVLAMHAALGVGCKKDSASPPSAGSASAPTKKLSLTLDWVPEPEFGGFYAARETGAFGRHGLDVDIKPRGGETWKRSPSATDFATTRPIGSRRARAGRRCRAIFAVYRTSPQDHGHKARGFTTIGDVFTHPGLLEPTRCG